MTERQVFRVRINQVETLVGITKKNIRFYEEQGLLSPRRSSENGYRDYSDDDVAVLCRVKLMRKLGVPVEEIRQMLAGTHTVADGMRRHLISLEREKRNVEQSMELCRSLQDREVWLSDLDAGTLLKQMEEMERSGATFQNKQSQDVRSRYIAPVAVALLFLGLMLGIGILMVWAYNANPQDAPPLAVLLLILFICVAFSAGVVLALLQRIREIGKGEADDAKKY